MPEEVIEFHQSNPNERSTLAETVSDSDSQSENESEFYVGWESFDKDGFEQGRKSQTKMSFKDIDHRWQTVIERFLRIIPTIEIRHGYGSHGFNPFGKSKFVFHGSYIVSSSGIERHLDDLSTEMMTIESFMKSYEYFNRVKKELPLCKHLII